MSTPSETIRQATHPIDPIFTQRWSPRSFTGEALPEGVLHRGFEAARWAPSGGNSQPWRFIYSTQGSASWAVFNEFLVEANRGWAKNSSALVILLSKKDFVWNGETRESSSYSLDAGAAWMSFALQLARDGWATHAMAGFSKEMVREVLNIPDNYSIELMIAVGKAADKSLLPEPLRAREAPSHRLALDTLVHEGEFKRAWKV